MKKEIAATTKKENNTNQNVNSVDIVNSSVNRENIESKENKEPTVMMTTRQRKRKDREDQSEVVEREEEAKLECEVVEAATLTINSRDATIMTMNHLNDRKSQRLKNNLWEGIEAREELCAEQLKIDQHLITIQIQGIEKVHKSNNEQCAPSLFPFYLNEKAVDVRWLELKHIFYMSIALNKVWTASLSLVLLLNLVLGVFRLSLLI